MVCLKNVNEQTHATSNRHHTRLHNTVAEHTTEGDDRGTHIGHIDTGDGGRGERLGGGGDGAVDPLPG